MYLVKENGEKQTKGRNKLCRKGEKKAHDPRTDQGKFGTLKGF